MKESAERRILQLEWELKTLQNQHAELQKQYAELYERCAATVERMKRLELRAAELIQTQDTPDSEEIAIQAMEALQQAQAHQKTVQDTFTGFEKFLETWMDLLQPSKALRLELTGHLNDLKTAIGTTPSTGLQPNANTGDGTGKPLQRCSILTVDRTKALVYMNGGLAMGIRTGMHWHLCGADGRILARLLTVDCRQKISVAILTQGDLNDLGAGAILLAD